VDGARVGSSTGGGLGSRVVAVIGVFKEDQPGMRGAARFLSRRGGYRGGMTDTG